MNRMVIYAGVALLFIPVVVNAGIPYAPQEKRKPGNAKQEYIGVRSNENPKVLHALAEAQKLKIGEVKRFYIPEYATKKTDVVVGEGNRIGRNVAAETIFADDGKVRETQNADATIKDAYGNRIIYDDQGNLIGKMTPDGWLFVRSTEWARIKKLDFLPDDVDQADKKSKKKSTESDRVGGSTPSSITMKDVIRALGPDDESQADKKGK